jgi:hypothetical protein
VQHIRPPLVETSVDPDIRAEVISAVPPSSLRLPLFPQAAAPKITLRSLIKELRIAPAEKRGECNLELVGHLATMLAICQGAKNKDGTLGSGIQASVVAGAGFEPTTFRL